MGSLVHCAAPPAIPIPLEKTEWEHLDRHLNIQVRSAFVLSQHLLPSMRELKTGNLLFMGSIFTDGLPPVQQVSYVVAKGALVSLMRSLAHECGPLGIRVNMVSPGMTKTDMIATLPEKTKLLTTLQTPLRRLALPEDVANSIAFLLSDSAKHITGENIRVCGGVVMV